MIYVLLFGSFAFSILNYRLGDFDLFNPSFLFCFIFTCASFVCFLGKTAFDITLHLETITVIFVGELIFTLIFCFFKAKIKKTFYCREKKELKVIHVHNLFSLFIIILQLLAIFFFIKYLKNISILYDDTNRSLSELISLYDTMTKFWIDTFNNLNVSVPFLYRIANPITGAASYLYVYIIVNNYMAKKSINPLHIIIVFLNCILILLNGSRSPLLRVITMFVVLFYILSLWTCKAKKHDIKFAIKLFFVVIVIGIFFILLLKIMRANKATNNIFKYLFIYLGAPIVNLDNFILKTLPKINPLIFGEQTFRPLYNYVGKIFHVSGLSFNGYSPFVFSSNGIEIGNVFTCFCSMLYDFGFYGIFPLTFLIAFYYVFTYLTLLNNRRTSSKVNLKLFFYAYLFNDLLMLFFSNRFYETVLDAPFIKLFIVSILIDSVFIEHNIKILNRCIKLLRFSDNKVKFVIR